MTSVLKRAPEIDILDLGNTDIIMLCETMCDGDRARTHLAKFYVEAVDPGDSCRGLLIASKFPLELISKGDNHVAVRCCSVAWAVFYFNPNTLLEDIFLYVADVVTTFSEPAVISGDFNCRLDQGDRGNELLTFMNRSGYSLRNNATTPTYISPNGQSVIDLIFISSGSSVGITVRNVAVNHSLYRKHSQLRFPIEIAKQAEKHMVRKTQISRRLDAEKLERLIGSSDLHRELEEANIDETVRSITRCLTESITARKRKHHKKWFDNDCLRLKQKLLALRTARERDNHARQEYIATKRIYKKTCENKRLEHDDKELDQKLLEIQKMPWKVEQRKANGKAPQVSLPELIRHFGREKNPGGPPLLPLHLIEKGNTEMWFNQPFTAGEVYRAILRTRDHKAAGPDNLTNEHLKQSVDCLLQEWTKLFNLCLQRRRVPSQWENSFLKVLYKGKGDPYAPDSYRGISLLNSPYKVLTYLINTRVTEHIDHLLPDNQFGFRRGRSTRTPLANLLKRGHEAKDNGGLFVLFVDFKSAFPSVARDTLLRKLKYKFNVDGDILGLIADILKGSTYQIDDGVMLTDLLPENRGVPQGDSLSPTLFLCYVTDLSEQLDDINNDLNHGFFADDLETDSPDHRHIQGSLDTIQNWCEANSISVNLKKTKIMKLRKGGKVPRSISFKYEGNEVEIVNEYQYLGVTIQPTLTFTKHIAKKIAQSYAVIGSLLDLRRISVPAALKVFMIKVRPVIEYGLKEISPFLTVRHLFSIDKVKAAYLKRVLGVHKSTRNTLTLLMAGESSLTEDLEQKLDLRPGIWENYQTQRTIKIDEVAARGHLRGPAFTNERWKKHNQNDRHCFTRLTSHGFHHRLCVDPRFHEISPGCNCKYCDKNIVDLFHALHCPSLTFRSLTELVKFFDEIC